MKTITLDLETHGSIGKPIDIFAKDIIGFSVKINDHNIIYDTRIGMLKETLEDPNFLKIFHNAKFEIHKLKNYGIEVKPPIYDTMLACWLLDMGKVVYEPSGKTHHKYGLKVMAEEHLNYDGLVDWEVLIKQRAKELKRRIGDVTTADIEENKLAEYCKKDVEMTYKLFELTYPLIKEHNLWNLYTKIEAPLVYTFCDMERNGVQLDVHYLEQLSNKLNIRLEELRQEMNSMVNCDLDWDSPKQIDIALFDTLKLPETKRTKTQRSTATPELEKIKGSHEIISLLLEYRNLKKLFSTYTSKWIEKVNPITGRLHAEIKHTGTETGRISMKNPNPMQIPKKTDNAEHIRKAFIAEPGSSLIEADYSQMDLRGLAHESEDPEMIRAFNNGEDIHSTTARLMNCDRAKSKAINFGIVYGKTAWGFAKDWNVDQKEAQNFLDTYLNKYFGVKKWMKKQALKCQQEGWISNLFGFKRKVPKDLSLPSEYVPGKGDVNRWKREAAERKCYNYPIQGFTAYATKKAMLLVQMWIKKHPEAGVKLLLQIHDALILECPDKSLEYVAQEIRILMENVLSLRIPLVVNVEVGKNLAEMRKV